MLRQDRGNAQSFGLFREDLESGLCTVGVTAFTDPLVFQAEIDNIFLKCWLFIGHEGEIPKSGDFITRKIVGRNVLITRAKGGAINAFLNVCRHKTSTLCREKAGNASRFSCVYHGWTYNNEGKLLGVAMKEAYSPSFLKKDNSLFKVHIASYRGLIFVNFEKEPQSLTEYLGPSAGLIDLILDQHEDWDLLPGCYDYGMNANWKILMENSLDALHVTTVHNGYFRDYLANVDQLQINSRDLWKKTAEFACQLDLGHGHSASEAAQFTPARDEPKRAGWAEAYGSERADRMLDYKRNITLFPNMFITEQFPLIRTYHPVSPDRTELMTWSFVPRGEDPEIRKGRVAAFSSFQGPGGLGVPDDVEVLEQCQENCRTLPADAEIDVSRGMMRDPMADDEFSGRVLYREWYRRLIS